MDPKSCLVRLKHQSFFTTEIITEIKSAVWSSFELNTIPNQIRPINSEQMGGIFQTKWAVYLGLLDGGLQYKQPTAAKKYFVIVKCNKYSTYNYLGKPLGQTGWF